MHICLFGPRFLRSHRASVLEKVHVSVTSWLGDDELPHVHPTLALAGTVYLECEACGLYFLDPRPPAGMADLPETWRERLNWGQRHRVASATGQLLLYPAWLHHGHLGRGLAMSFGVQVQSKLMKDEL